MCVCLYMGFYRAHLLEPLVGAVHIKVYQYTYCMIEYIDFSHTDVCMPIFARLYELTN